MIKIKDMRHKILINLMLILTILFGSTWLGAQKYFSKTGEIVFFSKSPIENIEAKSNSANTVLDSDSGKIQWAVLIKSFEFEKALMQEHFNENYMESSKIPKANFSGNIENIENIIFNTAGEYTANISGTLEIHGVSHEIKTTAIFKVSEKGIHANSSFNVLVADYDIKIPSVVRNNIAEEIQISINVEYEEFK